MRILQLLVYPHTNPLTAMTLSATPRGHFKEFLVFESLLKHISNFWIWSEEQSAPGPSVNHIELVAGWCESNWKGFRNQLAIV